MVQIVALLNEIYPSDQFLKFPESHLCHDLANFCGQKPEVIDQVLGLSREAFAHFRILGGYANGTGIQMALAHHDASEHDERTGSKSEFLSSKQPGINH